MSAQYTFNHLGQLSHTAANMPCIYDRANDVYRPIEKSDFSFSNSEAPTNFDAFGRLRVCEPVTLFESQHRYNDNGKWNNLISGTAASNYLINESAVQLNASNGGSITRESNLVFNYQAGKSLLTMSSFVFSSSTIGVTQKIGYFNDYNGIYLLQDGHADGAAFVLRSYASGAMTETIIRQKNWNCDAFDGNGSSGRLLNLNKANILWIDLEWLGVGAVRCGFVVDGKLMLGHIFYNDNRNDTVYMTTAILPLRCSLLNNTATSPFIKQICNTVISEGGHNPESITYNQESSPITIQRTTSAAAGDKGKSYNAVSIRLTSGKLDGIIIPNGISLLSDSAKLYQWSLIKNAAFVTSPTWLDHPACLTTQYTVTDSQVTGGTIVKAGYITNASDSLVLNDFGSNHLQLGRTLSGVSDTYTFAISSDSTSAKFNAILSWYQII